MVLLLDSTIQSPIFAEFLWRPCAVLGIIEDTYVLMQVLNLALNDLKTSISVCM